MTEEEKQLRLEEMKRDAESYHVCCFCLAWWSARRRSAKDCWITGKRTMKSNAQVMYCFFSVLHCELTVLYLVCVLCMCFWVVLLLTLYTNQSKVFYWKSVFKWFLFPIRLWRINCYFYAIQQYKHCRSLFQWIWGRLANLHNSFQWCVFHPIHCIVDTSIVLSSQ